MQKSVKPNRVEERSLGADNVEPPTAPLVSGLVILLAQFPNRLEGLDLGRFKVCDLDACFIQDCFATIHKVEEAAHLETCVT